MPINEKEKAPSPFPWWRRLFAFPFDLYPHCCLDLRSAAANAPIQEDIAIDVVGDHVKYAITVPISNGNA